MNRHDRRAMAARERKSTGPKPDMFLSLHCMGPFSGPTPQQCDRSVSIKMPFTHEQLQSKLWSEHGWYMTAVSPQGTSPIEVGVLCPHCAEALVPELVAEARKHMPGSA